MNIVDRIKRSARILLSDKQCPTLEVSTIFPCINTCSYCPQEKWRHAYKGKPRLTRDEFALLLKKIPKRVRLDFSGFSEPFANPEASLMMRHAFKEGYRVALFTTLVGLRPKDIDILQGVHLYPCAIHLPDDANFKVADEDRWLASFKEFTAHIAYDEAVYHIGNLSEKIRCEVEKIHVRPIFSRSNNAEETVVNLFPRQHGVIGCPTSANRFDQNVMMPNGDVYLCCMDWSLQHKLGNLFEISYEQLHQTEVYKAILAGMRDESIETICRYCERCREKNR